MSIRGVNKQIVMGRLGADPDLKEAGKTPVCAMSIATPGRIVDGEQKVEWVKCTVFGKTATNCGKFLKKGSTVYVEGRQQTDKYQAKDGTDRYSTKCIGERVVFVGTGDGKKKEAVTDSEGESFEFQEYDSGLF